MFIKSIPDAEYEFAVVAPDPHVDCGVLNPPPPLYMTADLLVSLECPILSWCAYPRPS